MSKQQLNRRTFLAAGTAGAAALGASAVVARGADDANSRLSIGVIGTGGRGGNLMSVIAALAEGHAAQITALCDVWQPNLDQAAHRVRGAFGKPEKQRPEEGNPNAVTYKKISGKPCLQDAGAG